MNAVAQRYSVLRLLLLTSVLGCTSLGRKGPVDDSVIMARHLCQQGLHAMHNARWSQAESAFAHAVEVCPSDQRARQHYADALWQRGEKDVAIEQMKTAIELSGGDPSLVVHIGRMYLERGMLSDSLQQADLALQTKPRMAEAWTLRGDVLQRQGNAQASLDSYHRALSIIPNDPQVRLKVAKLYHQLKRPRNALVVLQTLADQSEPGQEPPEVLFLQGLAMKEMGRYDDALQQLLLARHRAPPSADMLIHLAELELMTGDLASAHRDLTAARRLGADLETTRALTARIEAVRGGPSMRR